MLFRDLIVVFDEALEWAVDDALLADHLPSQLAEDDPSPELGPLADAEVA